VRDLLLSVCWQTLTITKLHYRKDDCAMHPIHGCPENFRDSLTMPMATIPNIFHGLLFRSTLWMFLQNLKSVALPIPDWDNIGGTEKIWAVPGYAYAPFSPKFLMSFYSDSPCKYSKKIINIPAWINWLSRLMRELYAKSKYGKLI